MFFQKSKIILEIKRRIFDKARVTLPRSSTFLSANIRLDNKGFTVLELLVATGIVVMLSVLFLANFRGFENKEALETEVDKMVSVLRQAQIYALTGQTISDQRYNYGVHLSECASGGCSYVFFADPDHGGNKLYDLGEEYGQGSFQVSKGVYIGDGDLISGGSAVNSLDIVFEAPLGDIYFNGLQPDSPNETAAVTLRHANDQMTITINRISGQIDVQ